MNKIYINGEFITLENTNIEAILVENGKIRKTGTKDEVLKLKAEKTQIIDLEGKTMMPACDKYFVDLTEEDKKKNNDNYEENDVIDFIVNNI